MKGVINRIDPVRYAAAATLPTAVSPEPMKVMVHNPIVKLGGDAGIKRTIGLLAPSLKTTLARRWPRLARL